MKVSVIIPTFNRAAYLTEAVDSVLGQTFRDFELVVVDDGSTDDTVERMKGYGARVRYLYQQTRGPAAARNKGIEASTGELIAFLDSDDMWLPEKLAKQEAFFRTNPSLGLVATAYGCIQPGDGFVKQDVLSPEELRRVRRSHYRNYFATSTVMLRRDCLEKVGMFDESLHFAEDWDMWIRVLNRYDFAYIGEILTKYRQHGSNVTVTAFEKNVKDWEKVIEQHSGSGSVRGKILRRRRLSWLYLNQAIVFRYQDVRQERRYMMKSIIAHPFCYPRRYTSLLKAFFRGARVPS